MRRLAILLLLPVLVIAACETKVSRPVFDDFTYAHLPPLRFDVSRIEIVDGYRSPLREPNVEHVFPTPPAVAVKRWVDDRLRTRGTAGALRVTILDASAVMVPLETNTDVEGLVTTEQAERVEARLEVLSEVVDTSGERLAFATTEVQRTRTLPEGLTLNERDRIYFEITEALLNDFNASHEQAMRQYLEVYLP